MESPAQTTEFKTLTALELTCVFQSINDEFYVEELQTHVIGNRTIPDQVVIRTWEYPLEKPIILDTCIFKEHISFIEGEYKSNIEFKHCIFHKGISFEKGKFSSFLPIRNPVVSKPIVFEGGDFDKVDIENCVWMQLNGGAFRTLKFTSDSIINDRVESREKLANLEIDASRISGDMYLSTIPFKHFKLTGLLTKGTSIKISHCQFRKFEFKNFSNDGQLQVLQSKIFIIYRNDKMSSGSELEITASNLAKAEFYSVGFSKTSKISFMDGMLAQCIFSAIDWNNESFLTAQPLEQRRELCRQLKISYKNLGDHFSERLFHRFELDTHLKHRPWWKSLPTKSVIWVSRFTSNYGESLLRPVLVILFINGLLFAALIKLGAIPNLQFSFELSWTAFYRTLGEFLWWNNPIRRLEIPVREIHDAGAIYILDTSIRIVAAYMLYNLVRATRRFIS